MWWLEAGSPVASSPTEPSVSLDDRLCLGRKSVRLSEITGYEHIFEEARDVEGLIIAGAGFSFAAMIFLIGVMGFGLHSNFLLAFVFMMFFGCASFVEVLGVKAIGMHRVVVWTETGHDISFCCSDDDQVERLVALLDASLPDE